MNALAPTYNLDRSWERQPCDTIKSWLAFQVFRDSDPPRTLPALSEAHRGKDGKPYQIRTLERWSGDHGWFDRVAEYDDHLDSRRIEVIVDVLAEDARAVANRHAGIARDAIDCAHSVVLGWVDAIKKGEQLDGWSPGDVRGMLKDMIQLERLVRGEATERVEHGLADLSKLSLEELQTMRALEAKAGVVE